MPGSLFDTSVWVALSFGSHPHFQLAAAEFEAAEEPNPAVFCRATQQSFLRQLSSPKMQAIYAAPPLANAGAWKLWEQLSALPQVRFADEPAGLAGLWGDLGRRDSASPKVWMNAYLAACAIAGDLRLVTLDRDFAVYRKKPPRSETPRRVRCVVIEGLQPYAEYKESAAVASPNPDQLADGTKWKFFPATQ